MRFPFAYDTWISSNPGFELSARFSASFVGAFLISWFWS